MNNFNRNETFSKFGKRFQENICQLMLEDRPFFDQITEVLDINFFEKKYLQIFSQTLINYRDKYNQHPNAEVMMSLLRTELNHHDNGVAQQVARSLQFFFSSSDFNGVDSVILAGGVAAIEGLEDFVRKRLNTKVVVADPLAGMTTATAVNSIALDADAPAMMVAIGLALRSFD